ncbi:MAG: nucleoside triphosphate hydrolase [Rhodobacteraceae bacterium]|nr:nucleoside triphosphate hydrolase [Paracoccaceae bacterium]
MQGQAITMQNLVRQALTLVDWHSRRFLAIAGAPGSGKSTLAAQLCDGVNAVAPGTAAILPMDGFHYDDAILEEMQRRSCKGAPDTFDVGGLISVITRLRGQDEAVAVPSFDRDLEISRGSARLITPEVPLIIVEGNYLLLQDPPWSGLAPLFDLSVMIDVPEAVLVRRLRARWAHYAMSDDAIMRKLEDNDLPNGRNVRQNSRAADYVLHRNEGD